MVVLEKKKNVHIESKNSEENRIQNIDLTDDDMEIDQEGDIQSCESQSNYNFEQEDENKSFEKYYKPIVFPKDSSFDDQ